MEILRDLGIKLDIMYSESAKGQNMPIFSAISYGGILYGVSHSQWKSLKGLLQAIRKKLFLLVSQDPEKYKKL